MRLNKFISHHSTYSRREADRAIQEGYVRVNGEIETRRKRQLRTGDTVAFQEHAFTVAAEDLGDRPRPRKGNG